MKKVFFSRPASSGRDLHPKRSPSPDFRDRGVSNGVTNAGQFFFVLGEASLYTPTALPNKMFDDLFFYPSPSGE